jgi:hypothetical protein
MHFSYYFYILCPQLYRCTNCGSDLEQKVNGVIQYIPTVSLGGKIPVLEVIEDGPPKA